MNDNKMWALVKEKRLLDLPSNGVEIPEVGNQ